MDYARLYPWPEGPWLRTQMVITLDGATTGADGLSGSISGTADKRVFMETRRLTDAVLVGAGTIRAERYKPMGVKPEWQEARTAEGLQPAPRIVIVSGRLDLPWEEPMFSQSASPITVATCASVGEQAREEAERHTQVVSFGNDTVDLRALLTWMRAEGMERIVCEGGEALLDGLVREDLVDEMDLTISPVLAGAGYLTGPPADALDALTGRYPRFSLAHEFADEGFVFCRFVRARGEQAVDSIEG